MELKRAQVDNRFRTHFLDQLGTDDIGRNVRLSGWVQSYRDMGGVIFILILCGFLCIGGGQQEWSGGTEKTAQDQDEGKSTGQSDKHCIPFLRTGARNHDKKQERLLYETVWGKSCIRF